MTTSLIISTFLKKGKLLWANYSTDQKKFTGQMVKLEEKSLKMSFKSLPVKLQWLQNRVAVCPP